MIEVCPLLAAIALLVCATGASAAPVPVRSGEHPDFTRLVFAEDTGRAWEIARPAADRVEVTFDGVPLELDLGGVFDRIPRARLTDLHASGGRLDLDLGCACEVEVRRIASGHIVIDILDSTVDWQPPAPVPPGTRRGATPPDPRGGQSLGAALPLDLPAADLVFPVLAKLAAEPGSHRQGGTAHRPVPKARPAAPQVRIMADREPRLLPERTPVTLAVTAPPACHLEKLALSTFLDDPVKALESLPALARNLLDGEDRFDPKAARALARAYLGAGMGAEAVQVQRAAAEASPDLSAIAAAFDATPRPRGTALDPACGPATTLVALLDADPVVDWDRADHRALIGLMDALPAARWRDVAPRLSAALAALEADQLLTGLHPSATAAATATPAVTTTVLASGTDAAAVEAAIALLADANARGSSAPESHLVNAMALRQSLPAGEQARRLDSTLATALVIARHPSEAVALAQEGAVAPATILSDALSRLPAVEAAEFAVRLRPLLQNNPDGQRQVDTLLTGLGLGPRANRIAHNPVEPAAAITEVTEAPNPWLARDLAALAAEPKTEWTGRNRLAEAIVTRNGKALPPTDLARADRVLEDSRALSVLISNLLAEPPS